MAASLFHYDDGNLLTDVLPQVISISPTDRPLLAMCGKVKATQVVHQWPEDSLAARTANAQIEGAAYSYGAITAPSRIANITQILAKTFSVSGSEIASKGAGVSNMFDYQQAKATDEFANDLELALWRQSLASGTGSAKRQMAGLHNFISTNLTAVASNTTLTESFFNGLVELAWTQGGKPDAVFVGSKLKRVISSYVTQSGGRQVSISAEENKIIMSVDAYQSDFGDLKIVLSRDMLNAVSGCSLAVLEMSRVKMAVLRSTKLVPDVPQDQDGKNGVMIGEMTLEIRAQKACALATGLAPAFVI